MEHFTTTRLERLIVEEAPRYIMQALRKRGDPATLLELLRALGPDEDLAKAIDAIDEAHRHELRMG